jgi:hypothetical protein
MSKINKILFEIFIVMLPFAAGYISGMSNKVEINTKNIKPDKDTIWFASYPIIDTLVIIQTYDTLPKEPDTLGKAIMVGGLTGPIELFKDGKRSDTMWKNTIIYK